MSEDVSGVLEVTGGIFCMIAFYFFTALVGGA